MCHEEASAESSYNVTLWWNISNRAVQFLDKMNTEQAKEFFKNDKFVNAVGIEIISAEAGNATCSLTVEDCHMNAANAVQGGVIYTLADFTFAVAANCFDKITVTLSNNIEYVKKAVSGTLFAHSILTDMSKRICFYKTEVVNENGELIASLNTVGYISDKSI